VARDYSIARAEAANFLARARRGEKA
jgi:hypothetical protein